MRALALTAATLGILVACGPEAPPPKPPAPPPPAADPAWLASATSACARISACAQAHDAPRMRDPGACVDWWLSEADPKSSDPLRKCLADAKTCDQVSTCMHGGGDARAAAFCAQRPGVVSGCDGDRLVSCGDDDTRESTVVDCTAMGATCKELKAAGGLVVRACHSPQKCPPGSPEARCDGQGAVIGCGRDGAIERVVCRPGTHCEEHKDETSGEATASCTLPAGRRCDMLGARHCEDDRLVECHGQGHFGKVTVTDCAGVGLRCAGRGPRAGCYVPANVECDKEMLPKCEGGSVVFCAAGRLARVSCAAVGMGACDPAARGPRAACSLPSAPGASASAPPAAPTPK